MTVIRPNSISGVSSITAQGGDINVYRADGTKSDIFINNITGVAATFTGVLTYEDVANVDSVGVITARAGLDVSGAPGTFSGGVHIDDSIVHLGDTNTKIRFPAADTITAETGGSERVRIDSNGKVLIGTSTPQGNANADDLVVATGGHSGITIRSGTSSNGNIFFADGTSGGDEYRGVIDYKHNDNTMSFSTNAVERLRIDSSGNVLIGTTDSTIYNQSSGEGIVLRGGDVIDIARSGDLQLTLNRMSNDGPHIAFYRDGGVKSFISTRSNAFCIDVNSSERLRIASDGKITVAANSDIRFTNGTWTGEVAGKIQHNSNNLYIQGGTGGIRFRHASSGVNQFSMTNGGNFEITNGDVVVASGHGIDFSATGNGGSSPSGISELFSDYETGTFTVTLANSLSVHTQTKLTYTKIGNKCHISGQFRINTGGSDLTINNLPFTTVNTGSTDETFSVGTVGLYYVAMPSDGNASGEIFTKTQKNDNNIYFVYNRNNTDPNSHTATANGYYTISHWYTVST